MNRISSGILVAFVPLLLGVAAYTTRVTVLPATKAPQATNTSTPPHATYVKATVTYRELVALAADARITVQLVEISRADGTEVVLGEQAIEAAGRPLPFEFEIGYDPASIKPNGVYLVGARIEAGGKLVYWTATRLGVITQGRPTTVELALTKAGPASYSGLALSSGRLAPSSY
jgi:putative lipoprotein